MNEREYELHAQMLNALAHPKRLMIVDFLHHEGEKPVGKIASKLGISLQNASQHLRVMRDRGLVLSRKDGQAVYYSLTSQVLGDCCVRVHEEIVHILRERGKLFEGTDRRASCRERV